MSAIAQAELHFLANPTHNCYCTVINHDHFCDRQPILRIAEGLLEGQVEGVGHDSNRRKNFELLCHSKYAQGQQVPPNRRWHQANLVREMQAPTLIATTHRDCLENASIATKKLPPYIEVVRTATIHVLLHCLFPKGESEKWRSP